MKKINKKTKKAVVKKTVKKAAKKTVKKTPAKKATKPKVKKRKQVKKKSLADSNLQSETQALGTKISVQEIVDDQPVTVVEDLAIAETNNDYLIEEDNINPEQESFEVTEEPIQAQESLEGISESEQYYMEKEMSPRLKNFILYASMTTIMGVLIVFWGLSIKNSFSQGVPEMGLGAESQEIIDVFQKAMDGFKEGTAELTDQKAVSDNQVLDDMKQQIINEKVKNDIANQLKDKLENLNSNNVNTNIINSN